MFTFFLKLLLSVVLLTPAQTHNIEAAVADGTSQRQIPSVVIRVDRDGQMIYNRAFGMRNLGDRTPATTATQYQYGSITSNSRLRRFCCSHNKGNFRWTIPPANGSRRLRSSR